MLRPLYRCMLRLHPPGFRKRFEDEILSIFDAAATSRDRIRLLVDGVLSLARQWMLRSEFWQGAPLKPAQTAPDGIPCFYSFDTFRPRTTAVIHGSILTVTLFLATCYAIRYSWIHVLHVRIPEVQFERSQWLPGTGAPSSQSPVSPMAAIKASAPFPSPSRPPLSQVEASGTKTGVEIERGPQSPRKARPKPEESFSTTLSPPSPAVTSAETPTAETLTETGLDPGYRHLVIDRATTHLKRYYIDPVAAGKMATALRRHERNGDDDDATDGAALADLLTNQMRQVSNDQHLAVLYAEIAPPEHQAGSTPEILARYQKEMERTNCTFERVELLPNNIGYVKLNSFPDLSICRSTAATAMTSLNEADAIIFDLRDNHGGVPAMVAFMASYLFEHPTHLEDFYNRAEHSTLQSWTLSPVVGNKLADKPAYVLISHSTFSGAEEFSYDMKMLKRATLVGETTAGGAHMTRPRRIDPHFSVRVPDTTPINPVSKTNWEGTGVSPDVKVRAADALTIAEKLAANKILRK
jgi:Peptidase family S41/N-terminal domain of Peptidase_S41 in eukaryotic IRBP